MGLTMKDPLLGKKFYAESVKTYKSFAGQDVIITGDFNSKIGCKDFIGGPIGSFARGIRNANGDLLFDFLAKHKILAANTFFKHKACQITTC